MVLVVELDDVDDVENGGSVLGTSAIRLVGWRVGVLVDGNLVATTILGTGGRTWVRFTMPPPQPQHATVLSMPEPGGESHSAKLPQVADQPGPGAPLGRHHCSRTYSAQDVSRALTQPGTSWHCVGPIVAVVLVAVSVVVVVVAVTDVAVWVDAVEVLELVAVVDVDDDGAWVGTAVGVVVGCSEGAAVGAVVGRPDGATLGAVVGKAVGTCVGTDVLGKGVGITDGTAVVNVEGRREGVAVGREVGDIDGCSVVHVVVVVVLVVLVTV